MDIFKGLQQSTTTDPTSPTTSDLYDPIDVLQDERESDQDPDWTPTATSHEQVEGSDDEEEEENDTAYRTDEAGLRPELQTPQPKNELKTSPSKVKLEPNEHGEGNIGPDDNR